MKPGNRAIKKVAKILIVALFAVILIFVGARYGWKLFGFNACENPTVLFVHKIEVAENKVTLSGDTQASAPAFVGYVYKIENNNLYIGLKYNLMLGFFERLGHFDVDIKCDTSQIDKIFLADVSSEEIIWEKAS